MAPRWSGTARVCCVAVSLVAAVLLFALPAADAKQTIVCGSGGSGRLTLTDALAGQGGSTLDIAWRCTPGNCSSCTNCANCTLAASTQDDPEIEIRFDSTVANNFISVKEAGWTSATTLTLNSDFDSGEKAVIGATQVLAPRQSGSPDACAVAHQTRHVCVPDTACGYCAGLCLTGDASKPTNYLASECVGPGGWEYRFEVGDPGTEWLKDSSKWYYRTNPVAPGSGWIGGGGSPPGADTYTASASWEFGPGPIGFDYPTLGSTLTRFEDLCDNITMFVRARFFLESTLGPSALLRYKQDDGVVVYVNGAEKSRTNMPAGSLTCGTLASSTVGTPATVEVTLDPGTDLVTGWNSIAAEVHQRSLSSSDILWEAELFIDPSAPVARSTTGGTTGGDPATVVTIVVRTSLQTLDTAGIVAAIAAALNVAAGQLTAGTAGAGVDPGTVNLPVTMALSQAQTLRTLFLAGDSDLDGKDLVSMSIGGGAVTSYKNQPTTAGTAVAASSSSESTAAGLSTGVLVGIVAAGLGVILALAVAIYLVLRSRRSRKVAPSASGIPGGEDPLVRSRSMAQMQRWGSQKDGLLNQSTTVLGTRDSGGGVEPPKSNKPARDIFDAAANGDIRALSGTFRKDDVNVADRQRGWTPLHHAANSGRLGAVELLLSRGASTLIRSKAPESLRAAELARRRKFLNVVDLIAAAEEERREKRRKELVKLEREARKMFTHYDADGGGTLDKDEIRAMLVELFQLLELPAPTDDDIVEYVLSMLGRPPQSLTSLDQISDEDEVLPNDFIDWWMAFNATEDDELLDEEQVLASFDPARHTVCRVKVLQARGLPSADRNGLSDPYCVLTIGKAKKKTTVIKKTLAPEWNETFELPRENPLTDHLRIVVKDWDAIGSHDQLGYVTFDLTDTQTFNYVAVEMWKRLHGGLADEQGLDAELLVEVQLVDPVGEHLHGHAQQVEGWAESFKELPMEPVTPRDSATLPGLQRRKSIANLSALQSQGSQASLPDSDRMAARMQRRKSVVELMQFSRQPSQTSLDDSPRTKN